MQPTIISVTGIICGRGSDAYKRVIGLTREERVAVRTGTAIVLVPDDNTHPQCTPYKQVTYYRSHYGGRYGHKNYYPPKAGEGDAQ